MKREKEKEYYGIYLNDNIPKIEKINKYSKEVEIKFEGKAFLIERDDDDEIIKRTEIENECKLKKEKDYEIEFTNMKNEIYYLQVRIETSYLFFILLLFWLGFLIGLILVRPVRDGNSIFDKFYKYIDLAVIQIDIDNSKEILPTEKETTKTITKIIEKEKTKVVEKEYNFDVEFNHISSTDINLTDTISAEAIAKNKIAPRSEWQFFNYNECEKEFC